MFCNTLNPFPGKAPDEEKQLSGFEPTSLKYSTETESENIFPNILELVRLVQIAYKSFEDPPITIKLSTEWERIHTASYDDGFRAAAFRSPQTRHLVIALPGTKTADGLKAFVKDLAIDIYGVGLSKEVSVLHSAILFTQEVLHLFGKSCISTTITGHSLGGYLAQICTLYAEYPNLLEDSNQKQLHKRISSLPTSIANVIGISPFHLHCVAIDPPGCAEIFTKILSYNDVKRHDEDGHERWRRKLESLDICVILADSNIVNTSKYHLQHIQLLSIVKNLNSKLLSSHAIQKIIESLNEESLQIEEVYETRFFRQHVRGDKEIFLKNWYVGRMDSCRINFLTKQEIHFLEKFLEINRCVHPDAIQYHSKFLAKNGDKIRQFCNKLENRRITCDILNRVWIEGKTLSFRNPVETKTNKSTPVSLFEVVSGLKIVFAEDPTILKEALLQGIFTNFGIQVVVNSISQQYLQKIPKIKEEVESRFAQPDQVYCLHVVAGNIPISLCMGYIAHGLQKIGNTKVMFSNSTTVIRWQAALKPENFFSELDTEVVVVEVDSELEGLDTLISEMREDAQTCGKLLILVTETLCPATCVSSDNCYEYGNSLSKSLVQALTWSDLNEESKDVLWNYKLNIYGSDVEVKNIFGGEREHFEEFQKQGEVWLELISYAYKGKVLKVVQDQKPLQCYISRQFWNLHLDLNCLQSSPPNFLKDLNIFVSCTDDQGSDVITLISPSDKFRLTLLHNDATKVEFLNSLTAVNHSGSSSHWFRFVDKNFVWQASAVTSCSRLLKCGGEIGESGVFDLESDCLVFADEPGMGKSALLQQLCYDYNQNWRAISKVSYCWPVLVNLNDYEKALRNTQENWGSVDSINNFFLRHVMKFESELVGQLFQYNFKRLEIVFFFDSFDELSMIAQRNVAEMLKTLRFQESPSFKLLITTGVHACISLEETLMTSAYKCIPFNRSQQTEFLLNRWNLHLQNDHRFSDFCSQWEEHKNTLVTFVTAVLDNIVKVIRTEDPFIGSPLSLVFFEELQRSGFADFCKDLTYGVAKDYKNYLLQFESKLALYEEFVDKKIDTYILDKKGERPTVYFRREHPYYRDPYEIHAAAAMLSLKESTFHKNCEIDVKDLNDAEKEKVIATRMCGISFTMDGSRSYRFFHKVLAEYFAAKYLVDEMKVNKAAVIDFLKANYRTWNFFGIGYFLDSILFKQFCSIKWLDKLQIKPVGNLRKHLAAKDLECVDKLGRTLLHYAARYGISEDDILWMIRQNPKNVEIEDSLGETFSVNLRFAQTTKALYHLFLDAKI